MDLNLARRVTPIRSYLCFDHHALVEEMNAQVVVGSDSLRVSCCKASGVAVLASNRAVYQTQGGQKAKQSASPISRTSNRLICAAQNSRPVTKSSAWTRAYSNCAKTGGSLRGALESLFQLLLPQVCSSRAAPFPPMQFGWSAQVGEEPNRKSASETDGELGRSLTFELGEDLREKGRKQMLTQRWTFRSTVHLDTVH